MGTRRPDAIFFQEICEKSAKPLELKLEGWAGPTYYGGDLNTTTKDVGYLDSLYLGHQECGQPTPTSPHTGAATDGGNEIDYIFGPQGRTYACRVVEGGLSDHKMIDLTTS